MFGGVQMYRAYRYMMGVLGHIDVWGHTDVQGMYRCMGGIQMYGWVYRCIGHRHGEMYGAYKHTGGIQMYEGCTNVWGAYRCMGNVQMYWAIQTYVGMLGAYKYTGGKQMYGGVDVWEDVQKYEEHTEYGGCTGVGGHKDTPKHTDSQTYPHMPSNYTCILHFL